MDRNDLTKIMFLDIETVPAKADFSELSVELAHLWEEKYNLIQKRMPEKYSEDTTPAQALPKAPASILNSEKSYASR